jgi:hypothetical protein
MPDQGEAARSRLVAANAKRAAVVKRIVQLAHYEHGVSSESKSWWPDELSDLEPTASAVVESAAKQVGNLAPPYLEGSVHHEIGRLWLVMDGTKMRNC